MVNAKWWEHYLFLVNTLIKWKLYLISTAKVSGENNGLWNSDTSSRHGLMIESRVCPDARTKPDRSLILRIGRTLEVMKSNAWSPSALSLFASTLSLRLEMINAVSPEESQSGRTKLL